MVDKELRTFNSVLKTALEQKKLALIFLLGSLMASITEMFFLGSLYAIFSPDKRILIFNWFKERANFTLIQLSFIERNISFIFIGLAIVILLLRLLSAISSRLALASIQTRTVIKLSNNLLSCFIDTHPTIWRAWKKEKIVSTITSGAPGAGEVIYTLMNMLLSAVITISLTISAYLISPKLTVFCISIVVIVLATNYFNYVKARRLGNIKVKSISQLLGHVYDVVSGHKILKLEGGEETAKAKMANVIDYSNLWLLGKAKNINVVMSVSEMFIYFFFFGLILTAHIFKIFDQAAILTLLVFAVRLQGSITDMQAQWMRYQELLPNFIDVKRMLSYADEYGFDKRPKILNRKMEKEGYALRLENVSFSYLKDGPLVLKAVNLIFPSNHRILITGVSGSGKSTFINIVCGILKPSLGKIYINNEELTSETFYKFRNYISYSSADAYIFKGTLRENISLGLDVNNEEIARAVKKAGLDEFVNSLGQGINSTVTDNAANISFGERQRIMLARMFLKKPSLILLDEATSNLDLELEDRILSNMVENLPNASIIIVTHRAPKNFIFGKRFELRDGNLSEMI